MPVAVEDGILLREVPFVVLSRFDIATSLHHPRVCFVYKRSSRSSDLTPCCRSAHLVPHA